MVLSLSVIIPTWNEEKLVGRAIRMAWETGANEVIVSDGGSEDATIAVASRGQATIVPSAKGRAVQLNSGARHAGGDVLIFLHADNWLDRSVGSQIRDALRDPGILGGALGQTIEATGLVYRLVEWGNMARARWGGRPLGDQAIFMRRETFEKLGGYPTVPIMEDVLLMRAFRQLASPVLLPGPVYVDARRWQQTGPIRQTLRNWSLRCWHALGLAPERLARHYPDHQSSTAPGPPKS
jgi:rSAM/selenodomain-associated transferase 2